MDETTSYRSSSSRASSSSRSRRVQTFSTLAIDRARASFPIVSVQFNVYVLFLAALTASSRSPLNSSRTSRPVARTNLNDAAPMSTTYFRPRPSARPTRAIDVARARSIVVASIDGFVAFARSTARSAARVPRASDAASIRGPRPKRPSHWRAVRRTISQSNRLKALFLTEYDDGPSLESRSMREKSARWLVRVRRARGRLASRACRASPQRRPSFTRARSRGAARTMRARGTNARRGDHRCIGARARTARRSRVQRARTERARLGSRCSAMSSTACGRARGRERGWCRRRRRWVKSISFARRER